ncbi:ImmA/IrrE family metallo-endopeptidase [Candidatus Roizmanbacteria bacterium]|nr:ImmA/IrrE family metallo-endopeptidase [Candidatus Roizmanbacteria bacterium]
MDDDLNSKPNLNLARKLARQLLSDSHITSAPVLLRNVAKYVPDLSIEGKEFEDEISGLQISYKGKYYICYNASHPVKRNRFTVAHEIAHIMLGHTTSCRKNNLGSKDPAEAEADQFAAELIMPLSVLKTAISTTKNVKDLASLFWVSKEAMSWRIIETKLFNKLNSWG